MAASLHQRFGRVDIFASCAAALGHLAPTGHFDPVLWQEIIDVNHTANWRLIRALDPLLRQSKAGRVVFVTSGAASRAELRAYWGPYAASKAALDALARTYAAETATTSQVRVMLVNPGPLRTRMRAAAMPGEDPLALRTPEDLAPKIVALCSADWRETGKLYDFPADRVLSFSAPT
jgi:NAD(P)-dependent dehydrogenase (short-subunit alcohol dehydrogenase family)